MDYSGKCCSQSLASRSNIPRSIRTLWSGTVDKINSKRLVVDNDLAYESGYGEIGLVKDGKLSINGGRFVTVWQRQKNGE